MTFRPRGGCQHDESECFSDEFLPSASLTGVTSHPPSSVRSGRFLLHRMLLTGSVRVSNTLRRSLVTSPTLARAATRTYSRPRGYGPPVAESWYGQQLHATTILSVRKDDKVFLIGDGQVSLGSQVIKPNARKVRQLKEGVICGFAGATADAMTLFERLEMKLQEHPETMRACVEMAKAWRMDKYLRRLEAIMIVCDANVSLTLTGTGDVIEPEVEASGGSVIGIGSGGMFATAAARALINVDGMDAETVGRNAMNIAADMCVYTVSFVGPGWGRGGPGWGVDALAPPRLMRGQQAPHTLPSHRL
jgi:ATP-dependent HslUV protease subunit HslV